MKIINLFIYFLLFTFFVSSKKQEKKPTRSLPLHNKKVVILGNSITQNGKYVDFVEYYLRKNYPNEKLNIISIGLSSETVSGDSEIKHAFPRPCIHSRLDLALKLTKPDLVLACYGMNDGIYSKIDSTRFNNYKNGIKKLKEKVRQQGAEIILMTPTPFDAYAAKEKLGKESDRVFSYNKRYPGYNNVLKYYSKWLLKTKDTKIINLNGYVSSMLEEIKQIKTDSTFIPDGVHPNTIGHYHMAKKILKDLYPQITLEKGITELNNIEKDSLYKLVSKRRGIRSKGWLNYIGYKKKEIVKSNDITTTKARVKQLDKVIDNYLKTK